jgi:multisubunit Na+/H+ antiporter MnhE subunit
MKWLGTKNLGMLLLAIWLIATGVFSFVHVGFAEVVGFILAALAISAGVLLLLDR